jgi:hypothetical protein
MELPGFQALGRWIGVRDEKRRHSTGGTLGAEGEEGQIEETS